MANRNFCSKCGRVTLHTVLNGCLPCLEAKERDEEREWQKLSTDEKLHDLERRVKNLEKRLMAPVRFASDSD